jgi:hypothetical protein
MTQNRDGDWVPATPEPFHGAARKQCQCGERFWTMRGYQKHYAVAHILKTI